jgi:hypothetical protein
VDDAAFGVLAKLRAARSPLDIFGRTASGAWSAH